MKIWHFHWHWWVKLFWERKIVLSQRQRSDAMRWCELPSTATSHIRSFPLVGGRPMWRKRQIERIFKKTKRGNGETWLDGGRRLRRLTALNSGLCVFVNWPAATPTKWIQFLFRLFLPHLKKTLKKLKVDCKYIKQQQAGKLPDLKWFFPNEKGRLDANAH